MLQLVNHARSQLLHLISTSTRRRKKCTVDVEFLPMLQCVSKTGSYWLLTQCCTMALSSHTIRYGGGFVSWGQQFRLRHMATGMFLGVTTRDGSNFDECCAEDESGWSLQDPSRSIQQRKRRQQQLTLFGPNEATKDVTAFCFSKANVS